MKIGILGSGVVGQALAAGFIKHGYEVMIGSRDAQKLAKIKNDLGGNLKTGDFAQTAKFAEIAVLAVKGKAASDVIKLAGIENLTAKTVLDTTNPIADAPPENGVLRFFTDLDHSLMEQLQNEAPKINFVKTFSVVGNALMVNPQLESKPTMFICGNSEKAKQDAAQILDKFGWETEDMGGAEAARVIEPLCILWCIPGFRKNSWMHAFKLLR